MKLSGVAPCQCSSSGATRITSPGWMRTSGPPRAWTKPSPSVTKSVWPRVCRCQAVWAHGVKCTEPSDQGDGPWLVATGSTNTSPVNQLAGPFVVGFFAWTSMRLRSAVHGQQRFDGAAFVHGAVALGRLVEREGEVEDLSRVDRASPDEVGQVGEEPPHWRGSAVEVGVAEEQLVAGKFA